MVDGALKLYAEQEAAGHRPARPTFQAGPGEATREIPIPGDFANAMLGSWQILGRDFGGRTLVSEQIAELEAQGVPRDLWAYMRRIWGEFDSENLRKVD